jgi:hypothetical protein
MKETSQADRSLRQLNVATILAATDGVDAPADRHWRIAGLIDLLTGRSPEAGLHAACLFIRDSQRAAGDDPEGRRLCLALALEELTRVLEVPFTMVRVGTLSDFKSLLGAQ